MRQPLFYHGKEMTSAFDMARVVNDHAVVDITQISYVRACLLNDKHVYGYLQPGDATLYDLILTPIRSYGGNQKGLIVTRLTGGDIRESIVLWDWDKGGNDYEIMEGTHKLGQGNPWSVELFKWWLTELCTDD